MGKVRIEIHLSEEDAAILDELVALNSRTRKNFCEMQIRGVISGHRNNPTLPLIPMVVQDLTKSNVAVEPPKQATSNYAINSDGNEKSRKEQILAEIEVINAETKPSMMAKSTYESAKKKRMAKLEVELEEIDKNKP